MPVDLVADGKRAGGNRCRVMTPTAMKHQERLEKQSVGTNARVVIAAMTHHPK
ncbi:hypothetical protein ABIF00_006880 [Bradyrhizobium elkanii]